MLPPTGVNKDRNRSPTFRLRYAHHKFCHPVFQLDSIAAHKCLQLFGSWSVPVSFANKLINLCRRTQQNPVRSHPF
ncbi:hypothetical protein SERLA73DRAFT_180051 [Serpula lacrymans var. lacrymans S7.3]|uniref:Uncharacterized protein n=2 Tax=Serpula lacrymans var. lacrymans TaxID=341189 RepID=F8PVK8_SERL3|nr:uncharacterized protein SERLADRAFT_465477 [Serpula lacrymans var. lacrymans S7.9]EGN99825.1 hypothetical protein SERLA73DRAFT_180051 [Serpula lacrymans var. lacrymans S7.3]EGO25395.1 hypothetical protein SERLADRAFT_465477 [Serpula lacrymans var. lacrymans S7.9]